MKIQAVTLFPDMFSGVMNAGMMWKAAKNGLLDFSTVNLREFGMGPRRSVDDTPYGGGDGMLLMVEPLIAAIRLAKAADPKARVVLMSPRGPRFTQAAAQGLADDGGGLIFVCGRYEGVDERVMGAVDMMISVGDYVLTGGELPALTVIDAVVRLIPGVLGGAESALIESFSDGVTLEFPQYTRPIEFEGARVPEVLLSGDHARIAAWRADNSAVAENPAPGIIKS